MNKNLWLSTAVAVLLGVGSVIAYILDIRYLPAVLMFVGALVVLGVTMSLEDALLAKYDTPHDEDTHPPQLIALRAIRAIIVIAMGTSIFVMVY